MVERVNGANLFLDRHRVNEMPKLKDRKETEKKRMSGLGRLGRLGRLVRPAQSALQDLPVPAW